MDNKITAQRIQSAKHACDDKGKGLTEKRQRVLEILLNAERPMSAYELTDAYNADHCQPIKAMSVYRILDYLTSVDFAHRLLSLNKYMVCVHPPGAEEHGLSLFMICSECQKVEESAISQAMHDLLARSSQKSGFDMHGSQLEISGLCSQCQPKEIISVTGNSVDEPTAD